MRIDAVVSAHDSDLCGVTRFNRKLAAKLGVPHRILGDASTAHALVSIKSDEVVWHDPPDRPYDVFLHDADARLAPWVARADTVYAANGEIAQVFEGSIRAWCPETLGHEPYPVFRRQDRGIVVFSTGMAHKSCWSHHRRLRAWLDDQHDPWWVLVSSGFHTGRDLERDLSFMRAGLHDVYGDRGIALGFLSNAMTRAMMASSTMVAAFFERGIRENNTTALAALRMGCPVVTTTDRHTPAALRHAVFEASALPAYRDETWRAMGDQAKDTLSTAFTWDALVTLITLRQVAYA